MSKRVVVCLLILGVSACEQRQESLKQAGGGLHGTQGTWSSAGAVQYRRYQHTATTLDDGMVLVAGGLVTGGGGSAGAELFNPAGVFSTLPGMSNRWFPTATRLSDGRVLLASGSVSGGMLSSSQLYDHSTRTFSSGGVLQQARMEHSATLLVDGRVLLAGGETQSAILSTAERYDPATGTFTLTGAMLGPRTRHASVGLPDGKVLVLGGLSAFSGGAVLSTAEVFDPATGTFQATGSMNLAREWPGAVLLGDGKVLVASGTTDPRAELYDPATGAFTFTGANLTGRDSAGMALLRTGEVLLAAGVTSNSWLTSVELYDPVTGTWRETAPVSEPRANGATAVLSDGRVLLVGGLGPGAVSPAIAEVYTPSTPDEVDTHPPSVAFASPAAGAFVGTAVTVSAAAADDDFIARVELLAGGVPFAELTAGPPYSASWSTAAFPEGEVTLTARAVDLQGNQASASIQVIVDRTAPAVAFTAPLDGAAVSGVVTLSASATDDHAVGSVAFYDGATLVATDTAPPYGATWNTGGVPGSRTLIARAYDLAGNQSSASITVTVVDPVPPSVSLSAPAAAAWVRGAFTTAASASDNVAVSRVEFLAGGALVTADPDAPYSATVDSATFADGPLSVAARAVDLQGNQATASVSVNVDNTPPVVAITAPATGSSVTGAITVTASATDAAMARVDFYDGAVLFKTDTTTPYSGTWSSSVLGAHTLTARAYDRAGNMTESAPVTITLVDATPPTVSISAPSAGAYVRGTFSVTASASDNVGVSRVELLAGGALVATDTTLPYSASIDSTSLPDGALVLTARAVDVAGNQTTSASRTVNVDNTLPVVAITAPAAGSTVIGSTTISATASDAAMSRVEFFDGTSLIASDTTAPYSVSWSSSVAGAHTLVARAYDRAGNTSSASVTVNQVPVTNAVYDPALKALRCGSASVICDSAGQLDGRASLGFEWNAPSTIGSSCLDGTAGAYHRDESIDRIRVISVDGTPMAAGKRVRIEVTVWVYLSPYDRLDLYHAVNANAPSWTFLATLAPSVNGAAQTLSAELVLPAGGLQAVRGNFRLSPFPGACTTGPYDERDDLVFAVQ